MDEQHSAAGVHIGPGVQRGRAAGFAIVTAAYLSALAAAVVAGAIVGTERPLVTLAVADLVGTVVIFIWSRAVNNSSMYDAYWSVVPPAAAVFFVAVANDGVPELRQWLVLAVVWFWAIRLTANWARGWPGLHHEDWRYVEARNRPGYWVSSFAGFHLFPTIVVYLAMLPLYPALTTGTLGIGVLDVVAVVVAGGSVIIEWVSDEQMRAFARTKTPGEVCRRGLWSWSRHPNYLGEMGFWWGLWLFALAADAAWWWTVIGPVAITVMFMAASIPMMEKRSLANRAAYATYAAEVSLIIPRPPRVR